MNVHYLQDSAQNPAPEQRRGGVVSRRRHKEGSALVLTLLVVSLLLVIVLAFVVHVRFELRVILEHMTRAQAKSNARLGLELAIANLQISAGKDQAVTANAELMGEPSVFQRKWAGVWSNAGVGMESLHDVPGFRSWLVSGFDRVGVYDIGSLGAFSVDTDSSGNPVTNARQVRMVGEGTVSVREDQVAVPRVVFQNTGTGRPDSFAYWVSDESMKARMNLPGENGEVDPSRRVARMHSPADKRLEDVEHLGPALGSAPEAAVANLPRLLRHSETGFVSAPTRQAVAGHHHDLGFHSLGLFTNPVEGGLKKDFSYAFEMSEASFRTSEFARPTGTVPNEFVTDNSGFSPQTKPVFNFQPRDANGQTPADAVPNPWHRGPTFDLIRDHYRLYTRVQNPFTEPLLAAKAYFPNSFRGLHQDPAHRPWRFITAPELHSGTFERNRLPASDSAVTDSFVNRNFPTNLNPSPRPRFTETEVAPEIIRFITLYSVTLNDERPSTLPTPPPCPDRQRAQCGSFWSPSSICTTPTTSPSSSTPSA
jgi:hypothetical protein